MDKPLEGSIIGDMKIYLQRWWIINRLYHYQIKEGLNWGVMEDLFMWWLLGIDMKEAIGPGYTQGHDKRYKKESRFFLQLFFGFGKLKDPAPGHGIGLEIERTISDCIDDSVGI